MTFSMLLGTDTFVLRIDESLSSAEPCALLHTSIQISSY